MLYLEETFLIIYYFDINKYNYNLYTYLLYAT